METTNVKFLTEVQERRIMTYVEEKALDINRAFQKRHMSSSKLRTLPDYISAIRVLIFDLVMVISPMVPSGELRVSLLLRLTADLLDAAPGYAASISPDENDEDMSTSGGSGGSETGDAGTKYPLVELFDVLHELDNAWAAVLSCQVWNNESQTGEDVMLSVVDTESQVDAMEHDASSVSGDIVASEHGIKLYAPSDTESTRLRSMILAGMSAIEDWLDEGQVPDVAKEPFEQCFDLTLSFLGEESNEASFVPDGFVGCGATSK